MLAGAAAPRREIRLIVVPVAWRFFLLLKLLTRMSPAFSRSVFLAFSKPVVRRLSLRFGFL